MEEVKGPEDAVFCPLKKRDGGRQRRRQKLTGTKLVRLLHYYHSRTQVFGVLLATLEAVVRRLVMREAWYGSRTKIRRF